MVGEHLLEHSSQWVAITSIAAKIGCTAESFRRWVHGAERENREPKRVNDILRKASAYFAQSEFDRRGKW